jgi:hypothetical protein
MGPPLRWEEGVGLSVTRTEQNSNLLLAFAVLTDILIRNTLHYIYLKLNDHLRVRCIMPSYVLCIHLVFVTGAPESISGLGNVFIIVFSRETQKVLADLFSGSSYQWNILWSNADAIKLTPCVFMSTSLTSGNTGVWCCNTLKPCGWQHFFRRRGLFREPGVNPIHGHFIGWKLRSLLAKVTRRGKCILEMAFKKAVFLYAWAGCYLGIVSALSTEWTTSEVITGAETTLSIAYI